MRASNFCFDLKEQWNKPRPCGIVPVYCPHFFSLGRFVKLIQFESLCIISFTVQFLNEKGRFVYSVAHDPPPPTNVILDDTMSQEQEPVLQCVENYWVLIDYMISYIESFRISVSRKLSSKV